MPTEETFPEAAVLPVMVDVEDQTNIVNHEQFLDNSVDGQQDPPLLKHLLIIREQQEKMLETKKNEPVRSVYVKIVLLITLLGVLFFTAWAGAATSVVTASTKKYDLIHESLATDQMEPLMKRWRNGKTIVLNFRNYAANKEVNLALSPHGGSGYWVTDEESAEYDVEYTYYDGSHQVIKFGCFHGSQCDLIADARFG